MKSLFCGFFAAYYDIKLTCVHIVGVANSTADHLSCNNMTCFFSLNLGFTPAYTAAATATSNCCSEQPRLNFSTFQKALQSYHHQGLAAFTHKIYTAGIQRNLSFCKHKRSLPLPASEQTLLFLSFTWANLI